MKNWRYKTGQFLHEHGVLDYSRSSVENYSHCLPFMMKALNKEDYRFGFNGKEMDNETSGTGNQYDYGFRIYNPRIAKFLSVDPLTKSYPWYTPYQFAGNKPIWAIDLDGLEEVKFQLMEAARVAPKLNMTTDEYIEAINEPTTEAVGTFVKGTGKFIDNYLEGVAHRVVYGGSGNMPFENTTHFLTAPRDAVNTVKNTIETGKQFPYMSPEDQVATLEGWALTGIGLYYGGKQLINNFKVPYKPGYGVEGAVFEIDASFIEGLDNLSGKVDLGWYDGNTAYVKISAINKARNMSKNSGFKNLTTKAEELAKANHLNEVTIEFKEVVNPRLKFDKEWAKEYGYHYYSSTDKLGSTTVTWTKTLE